MRGGSAFRAVDVDESCSIDFAEWCDALSVGMNIDVAEDLRLALWREADVDGNDLIDFKEFTLVITLLYLLDFVEGEEAAATGGSAAEARDVEEEAIDVASSVRLQGKAIRVPAEVQSAIDIVVDAFLFFDADGDGRINKTEVIGGLDVNASDAKGKPMKGLKARAMKKGWCKLRGAYALFLLHVASSTRICPSRPSLRAITGEVDVVAAVGLPEMLAEVRCELGDGR